MRKPLRSPIDRRYRHGGTLSTAVLFAVAGAVVCAVEVGVWWLDLAFTILAIALIVAGVGTAARELAKPCRFTEADPQVVPPIPRSLRDERGRAS
jgi:hypothetical protein